MNGTTLEEPPPRTRAQHGGPGSRHPWADVTRELLTQMTGQDIVAALMIAGALIATWPLLMRPPGAPALVPLVAHVAGMLAGFGVLVVLLFVARTPVLERDVGADVLSRWHATTAKYALGLILLHACAATLGWAQSRGEPLATSALHVLRLPWIPAATVATVLMLVV